MEYLLMQDGKYICHGTYNDVLFKLQQLQPFSYEYATTWGGYKIVENKKWIENEESTK